MTIRNQGLSFASRRSTKDPGNVVASNAQNIANKVMSWSSENRVQLNPDKCKELRISFSNQPRAFDPVVVDGKELDVVDTVELLGVTLTNQLTWNPHIEKVIKKACKRLYFPVQLKREKLPIEVLVLFYITCIRSVIDYAIPAFYSSLPQNLKSELVLLEKKSTVHHHPQDRITKQLRKF